MLTPVVVDAAGGGVGGAARWAEELDGFLAAAPATAVSVIGRHRPLTPGWLLRRERRAAGCRICVAANSVSFVVGGAERRVVLRNALHFLHPAEEHLLTAMPRTFRAQIPLVRRLLTRADLVVAPSSTMAERVGSRVPAVRNRIVVRPHPVTPVGPRTAARRPFILVPVLPAPYKNLVPELLTLVGVLDRLRDPVEVWVTARPRDLSHGLAGHPRLTALGTVPVRDLGRLWRRAAAAFFPSTTESFGYPLAEARVYGVPVLAPEGAQAREVAGGTLLPYRPGDAGSLAAAVERRREPVPAQPHAFDRDEYFRWLLRPATAHPASRSREPDGIAT